MNKKQMKQRIDQTVTFCTLLLAGQAIAETTEQVDVIGEQLFRDTTIISPTSRISAEELDGINFITAEDAISYEPSVVVRRRYIGDSNGVIGIRGSNMFQTTRSMVFADGLPLHYFLQTSFSGSPRWSLVGSDEIENVEVVYGPFSAEYSGNAMGGVVNMTTRDPQEERVVLEGTLFAQQYDILSTDETYFGGKLFASYENKIDNLGVFISFTHLNNDSHPQTQFVAADGSTTFDPAATEVTGTIAGVDENGSPATYYGDSGSDHVETNLIKVKLNYDGGNYQARGIVAYENRTRDMDDTNNYLRDAAGNVIYDSTATVAGTTNTFSTSQFGTSNFQERYQERESLLLGAGLSGELGASDWVYDIYATNFDILKDEEIRTGRNPDAANFSTVGTRGRFTEFDNTGWTTLDVKAGTESFLGDQNQRLSVGVHYSKYELQINPFRYNPITATNGTTRGTSGGETRMNALFAQWGWAFDPKWDLALGVRYEDWQGRNGFFDDDADGLLTGTENQPNRDESGVSPKFSLAHFFNQDLTLRYSLAKALRFPVTEELYQNVNEVTQQSIANADLKPEEGIHHNLMLEQKIKKGYVRANLFYEEIDDAIFNQNVTINGATLRTFLPIETVETTGLELVFNQQNVVDSLFDIRFNVAYIKAEIAKNALDTSIVGNDFPRMPRWRANLLVAYPVSQKVDVNTGVRYASNSYGTLANSDTASNVFGAQDDYLFVNTKLNWKLDASTRVSVGIDNIFNEEAYVRHQWPSRTFFIEGKIVL